MRKRKRHLIKIETPEKCKYLMRFYAAPAFVAAGLIVFADQLSKYFVRELIYLHRSILLIENIFYLTYIQNPGAAFGLFRYQTELLIGVSTLTIAVLVLISIRISRKERFFQTALGFIIGGAMGNLIDRVSFGHVIDFLDLGFREHRWPVFNVADIAITVGSVIIIWKLLKKTEHQSTSTPVTRIRSRGSSPCFRRGRL